MNMDSIDKTFYSATKIIEHYEAEFDPERTDYTQEELHMFADALLWMDRRETGESHDILTPANYQLRKQREVYVGSGVPDPAISNAASPDGQTMFFRPTRDGLHSSRREHFPKSRPIDRDAENNYHPRRTSGYKIGQNKY